LKRFQFTSNFNHEFIDVGKGIISEEKQKLIKILCNQRKSLKGGTYDKVSLMMRLMENK